MKYPSLFNGLINFDAEWDNFMPTPKLHREPLFHGWLETEENFSIQFDVPGLNKDQIKIETDNQMLSVSGVRELKQGSSSMKNQYQYKTYIPESLDTDKIEASLKNGVLTLVAPKSKLSKNKQITIKD